MSKKSATVTQLALVLLPIQFVLKVDVFKLLRDGSFQIMNIVRSVIKELNIVWQYTF